MLAKLKQLISGTATRPLFVVGTGRSGTHWLGYSLGDHPGVRAAVEVEPMFGWATQMAMNPSLEDELFPKLVRAYRWQLVKSAPRLFMEKTHPNIWLAEKLKAEFPAALFIGIERNPFATVASMMKHKGVAAWHSRWRKFPIPNRFLGIDEQSAKGYEQLPLPAQCAMRWVAHSQKMAQLDQAFGDDMMVIQYETFADQTEQTIHKLQHFLGLQDPIPVPEVRRESLNKWQTQLTAEQLEQISAVVGLDPRDL